MNIETRSQLGFGIQRLALRCRRQIETASTRRWGAASLLLGVWMATGLLAQPAAAASIPYLLSDFTLVNSNADGTAVSMNGGTSVLLMGGNNGSGLTGATDLIAIATGPGTILFHYFYSSLDSPGFDWAGYLIGSQFTQLADTDGELGTASFSVLGGDVFGFRIETYDNTSEPGYFVISDFRTGATSVPEPATLPFLLIATAAGVLWRRSGLVAGRLARRQR